MGGVVSLILTLVIAVMLVVITLIIVALWRLGCNRKWSYFFLLILEMWWGFILGRLFALVGIPVAWQIGMQGALLALIAATFVLLYRHRHDPDAENPEAP